MAEKVGSKKPDSKRANNFKINNTNISSSGTRFAKPYHLTGSELQVNRLTIRHTFLGRTTGRSQQFNGCILNDELHVSETPPLATVSRIIP